jgi:hypothetical protein
MMSLILAVFGLDVYVSDVSKVGVFGGAVELTTAMFDCKNFSGDADRERVWSIMLVTGRLFQTFSV